MKRQRPLVSLVMVLFFSLLLLMALGHTLTALTAPAELHVCHQGCPYASIQAAVDAAASGDLIKIAGGVYTDVHARAPSPGATTRVTQVVYISKTLTLQGGYAPPDWSTADPEANPTTLEAGGQGRGVVITGDISPTLAGLVITGGDATGLGGDSSMWGQDAGGGIYVISATVTLAHNRIISNVAEYGGGLYMSTGAGEVRANTIVDNFASAEGGGVGLHASTARLVDNTIRHNTSSWGGGLYLHESPALLDHNAIVGNAATGRGGGALFLWWSDAVLRRNRMTGNTSPWETNGGIHVFSSAPILDNNVIAGNQSGGMRVEGTSQVHMRHNTIADNGADGVGLTLPPTLDRWGTPMYGAVTLTNTVLVSHSVGISVTGGNTATVSGILWYGTPVTVSQSATATVALHHQRTGDPAFAPDGYHITAGSAAMDAALSTGVNTDIDGQHRPYNTVPDLGADEVVASTVPTDVASSLIVTDTTGRPAVIDVPAAAVPTATVLVYTPAEAPTGTTGFAFAGSAFELDAYREGAPVADFTFAKAATITLQYTDAHVIGLQEDKLLLQVWNASAGAWEDAACGPYVRYPEANRLAVPICHLSRFALFGPRDYRIYLPAVVRD